MRIIIFLTLVSLVALQWVAEAQTCAKVLDPCDVDSDCCEKICHQLVDGPKVCHYNQTLRPETKVRDEVKPQKDKPKKPKKNSSSSEENDISSKQPSKKPLKKISEENDISSKRPPKKPLNKSSKENDIKIPKGTTFKYPEYTRQPTKSPKSVGESSEDSSSEEISSKKPPKKTFNTILEEDNNKISIMTTTTTFKYPTYARQPTKSPKSVGKSAEDSSSEEISSKKPPKKPFNTNFEENNGMISKVTTTTFKYPTYARQPTESPKSVDKSAEDSTSEEVSSKKPPKKPLNSISTEKGKRVPKVTTTTLKYPVYTRQPTKSPKSEDALAHSSDSSEEYEYIRSTQRTTTNYPVYIRQTTRKPRFDTTEPPKFVIIDHDSEEHNDQTIYVRPPKKTPTIIVQPAVEQKPREPVYVVQSKPAKTNPRQPDNVYIVQPSNPPKTNTYFLHKESSDTSKPVYVVDSSNQGKPPRQVIMVPSSNPENVVFMPSTQSPPIYIINNSEKYKDKKKPKKPKKGKKKKKKHSSSSSEEK